MLLKRKVLIGGKDSAEADGLHYEKVGHSRESGNPVRGKRIAEGLRSGFPLSWE
jgi:hypothetical protein